MTKQILIFGALAMLACGQTKKPPPAAAKPKPIARECDPAAVVFIDNGSGVSAPFKCSAEGKYVFDKAAYARQKADDYRHRHDLYWALRTRLLSVDEMKEVEQLGIALIIEEMQPYRESEKQAELNAALLQQFKIRLMVEESKARLAKP